MDAVCYQGRISVGLEWGVFWLLGADAMIRAIEGCHALLWCLSKGELWTACFTFAISMSGLHSCHVSKEHHEG